MNTVKFIAINSDVETCACCGKSGLKRVVWLQFGEPGSENITAYGTNCAARALGLNKTYTAKTAGNIKADYSEKIRRDEARKAALLHGQQEANKTGVVIYLTRSRDGHYITVREPAFLQNSYLYGPVVDSFTPAAIAA